MEVDRETVLSKLNLLIDSVAFPVDSEQYVANYLDDAISQVETIYNSQGADADPSLLSLLNDLQSAKADFGSQNADEIDRIARLLFANTGSLFSNTISAQSTYSAQFDDAACTSAQIGFVSTTVATIAFSAIISAEPTVIGKVIFAAPFSLALYNLLNETENLIDKCPRKVISSIARSLTGSARSLVVSTQSEQSSSIMKAYNIHYAKLATTPVTLDFYDGVASNLVIEVEEVPEENIMAIINKIKWAANSISLIVPKDLLAAVNLLGEPKKRDITDTSQLEQLNTSAMSCSGPTDSYTCKYPDNGGIHSDPITFNFNITHPDLKQPIVQAGKLLPRDIPVINNQTFTVVAGPGEVNRIQLQVVEDTTSPNYELTKVLGFALVSSPTHGVILNEFNEFGVLDYAADIIDDMPEEATLEVRVWNRYGYSETATITLSFKEEESFTKISSAGDDLPVSASEWSCVRDNNTGLVWEVKTASNTGVHSININFGWSSSSDSVLFYIGQGLCGYSDWRVPSKDVLITASQSGTRTSALMSRYFPYPSGYFWSLSADDTQPGFAWSVSFINGDSISSDYREGSHIYRPVRLVRGEE